MEQVLIRTKFYWTYYILESYSCSGRVAQPGEHLLCKQREIPK